jgi:hypothetical protein
VSPEQARIEYSRWVRAWGRHGVRIALRMGEAHLWRQGRYGPPSAGISVPLVQSDAVGNLTALRAAAEGLMIRPQKAVAGAVPSGSVSDPQMQQRCPTLWEYLTTTTYDDGSPREPSTLLVFLQEGSLKGMIRDKDGDRCLWAAARSLVGLLDALDGALGDPQADWRPDRKAAGQPAPRGKRAG